MYKEIADVITRSNVFIDMKSSRQRPKISHWLVFGSSPVTRKKPILELKFDIFHYRKTDQIGRNIEKFE